MSRWCHYLKGPCSCECIGSECFKRDGIRVRDCTFGPAAPTSIEIQDFGARVAATVGTYTQRSTHTERSDEQGFWPLVGLALIAASATLVLLVSVWVWRNGWWV